MAECLEVKSDRRRWVTLIIRNALMTPFIPIRVVLFALVKIGEAAEWIGLRTPGWAMFNGWRGW